MLVWRVRELRGAPSRRTPRLPSLFVHFLILCITYRHYRPTNLFRWLSSQSQKQNVPPRSILIVNKHRTRAVAEGIEALLR